MKHLMLFVVEERAMYSSTPEEQRQALERWSAFDAEAAEKGVLIACEPLETSASATTVDLRADDEQVVRDGPFAETKEQIGGFCLIDCESREEALEWASKVPMELGSIEIRPILDLSEFGYESRTLTPARA